MVVIKNEDAGVLRIGLTTHAPVAGTEIAILHVGCLGRADMGDGLAARGPILAMRRNDHPFFAQRMPALFPSHSVRTAGVICRHWIWRAHVSTGGLAHQSDLP